LQLKYILTLSTAAEPGRTATLTQWSLCTTTAETVIDSAGCAGDPHGDHARVAGRAAAKKHAASLGKRIVDADVRVVYKGRRAVAPA
jgi:hypothetical protein